jgi:hypothetical protein
VSREKVKTSVKLENHNCLRMAVARTADTEQKTFLAELVNRVEIVLTKVDLRQLVKTGDTEVYLQLNQPDVVNNSFQWDSRRLVWTGLVWTGGTEVYLQLNQPDVVNNSFQWDSRRLVCAENTDHKSCWESTEIVKKPLMFENC